MVKFYFTIILVVAVITVVYCTQKTKVPSVNTYAIQNLKTKKNLRPFEAKKDEGNKIVQYNLHRWGCLTWELIPMGGNIYKIKNLYTLKTFQPRSQPTSRIGLSQQSIKDNIYQEWEFIELEQKIYLIKLKEADLYLSTSSVKTNSEIILLPKQEDDNQKWKLIKQKPWI